MKKMEEMMKAIIQKKKIQNLKGLGLKIEES